MGVSQLALTHLLHGFKFTVHTETFARFSCNLCSSVWFILIYVACCSSYSILSGLGEKEIKTSFKDINQV